MPLFFTSPLFSSLPFLSSPPPSLPYSDFAPAALRGLRCISGWLRRISSSGVIRWEVFGKGREGPGGFLLFLQFLDCGNAVSAWRVELYDGAIVRVEKPSVCVL